MRVVGALPTLTCPIVHSAVVLIAGAQTEDDAWVTLPAELGFVLVLLPFALIALWIYTIVNAAKYGEGEFRAVRSSKTMWIVLLVLFGFWVAPLYYATAHRRLRRLRQEQTTKPAAPTQ